MAKEKLTKKERKVLTQRRKLAKKSGKTQNVKRILPLRIHGELFDIG